VFTTQNSILPSNLIGSIVIDRNNVKWIGTANGMVRIEGNNWQLFDTTNTPLEDNSIAPRTIDLQNNLWVSNNNCTGSAENGILCNLKLV
jgi:ligand-binding sensor domain-containing protein